MVVDEVWVQGVLLLGVGLALLGVGVELCCEEGLLVGVGVELVGVVCLLEVLLGLWAYTGWRPVECAAVQTTAIVAMNTLEIFLAGELLISAIGMVLLNLAFLSLVWLWVFSVPKP